MEPLDQDSVHALLYADTINNVPVKYSLENSDVPYQKVLYANTNDVQEHVCNSLKSLDIDLNAADNTLDFSITESLHLRNCRQNNDGNIQTNLEIPKLNNFNKIF